MRTLSMAVTAAAFIAAAGVATPDAALAKSDKAKNPASPDCMKLADPRQKDECVSNARNRLERGQGISNKADKARKADKQGLGKGPGKAKGKKK